MITGTAEIRQVPSWQASLARSVTDPAELLSILELDIGLLPGAIAAAGKFRLQVPRSFVARMRKGDPNDPLLRQVLPLSVENTVVTGYVEDPVGDRDAVRIPGLLQKYRGRVLLTATGVCAVNCRYCFRRHFPYAESIAARDNWKAAIDYVKTDPEIEEVILSGGDPLALADRRILELAIALNGIEHVRRLRIHTRFPVVLPERVTDGLCRAFESFRGAVTFVIHANHAQEINAEVGEACFRLKSHGAYLLNQSVILRGINDSVQSLRELSVRLFDFGVLPYYLHLLDPVQGAAHFNVPVSEARKLVGQLQAKLPGYLVPRLVRETPGAASKTVVF